MVSAPGKVIVYGEHAVVYGKAAIAAAISLRSYLLVTPIPPGSPNTITLRFTDIGLDHNWPIDNLPWAAFNHPDKKKYYFDEVRHLDPDLVDAIKPFTSSISEKVIQSAAACFLYLYLSLGSQHSPPSIYALRSTIPIAAGLGSSASISVCLSAALQLQHGTLTTPFPGMLKSEILLQQKRINNWAFVGEMCIHGNPSGVDNTVSVQGKAVVFKRRDYSLPPTVTSIESFPELPLMLVNTKTPRRTAEQVANVKKLLGDYPVIVEGMLQSIDCITQEALTIINPTSPEEDATHSSLIRLGELIRINHGLLVSLGVSHPRLERIRELVDHAGIGWTKLTGAGGGGCSITLLKSGVRKATMDALAEKFNEEGFERYATTLGGDGVGVLWPAVVRRKEEDGEGGIRVWDEVVTQELFLEAKGLEGVERLVGVSRVEWVGNGWRFWRGEAEE
ncbi:mevalonate kinase [Terfezia boudieri ATCC MYA-4762]|uniref:Mevalonate kinase n=1 Tax=Terfezia boudieri ATCC MYA-4762 TaxID=1051890 RepID=A0A3N4MKT3_9PEZI|nr:mevalonate kinase [Terfezia boudieri ATCC MYA-4762]